MPALMVTLEMQAGRRDDAEHALQGREGDRSATDAGEARRFAADDLAFELRRDAIGARRDRLPQRRRPLRQLENRRIALAGACCQRCRQSRTGGQETFPQKVTAPGCHGLNLFFRKKVLRSGPQTPRSIHAIHHSGNPSLTCFTHYPKATSRPLDTSLAPGQGRVHPSADIDKSAPAGRAHARRAGHPHRPGTGCSGAGKCWPGSGRRFTRFPAPEAPLPRDGKECTTRPNDSPSSLIAFFDLS